jgi:hypothetical protein
VTCDHGPLNGLPGWCGEVVQGSARLRRQHEAGDAGATQSGVTRWWCRASEGGSGSGSGSGRGEGAGEGEGRGSARDGVLRGKEQKGVVSGCVWLCLAVG